MARPTVADLVDYLKLYDPTDAVTSALNDVLATAVEAVEDRINLPTGDYPQRVRTAVLLTAARLAKRSASSEGVAGFGDFGAIRISALDVDVEALIERFLKLDGFA